MRISPRVVSSAAAIALTCAVTAAAYFYKSRSAEINEVMVFCKLQFNAYGCFDQLMSYVEAAKNSVSICMPGIQNVAIQGRLVKMMQERNIKIRIIVAHSGYDPTDFLLKELIELGAEIKCYNGPLHHLHLKFCLVDDKVLLTGTLNWGSDRSSDHWNYVYITNKSQLVKPVKEKFGLIWNYSKEYPMEQENQTGDQNETGERNENDSEDGEGHIEDHESHTEGSVSHTESRDRHSEVRQSHTEGSVSHTEDRDRPSEDRQSHAEGSVSHTEDRQSLTEDRQSHTELPSPSQILNAIPDFSDCAQVSQTIRETVSTPEVYIN